MQLNRKELVALAKHSEDSFFRPKYVALAGGVFGSAAFLVAGLLIAECRNLEDAFFYLGVPSLFGGLLGACAAMAIFLSMVRRKTHPALGAVLGAILAPAICAFLMLLLLIITGPDSGGEPKSVSGGLAAGFEAAWWVFVYIIIVLPASIIAGAAVGWLLNRR